MSDLKPCDCTLGRDCTLVSVCQVEAMLAAETARADGLQSRLTICIEALDRLARLGNEPLYGNSGGNSIAHSALIKVMEDKL